MYKLLVLLLIVTGQFWNVVQGSQGAELGYYGAPLKDLSYPRASLLFAREITKNHKELPLPSTLAQALEKHPVKNLTIEVVAWSWLNMFGERDVALRAPLPEYNLVFHKIIPYWHTPNIDGVFAEFNVNITAGIFVPTWGGATKATQESIAVNDLSALQVHRHNVPGSSVPADSPNNGRFAIVPGRRLVTFWVAGFWNDHGVITYVIMELFPGASFVDAAKEKNVLMYAENDRRRIQGMLEVLEMQVQPGSDDARALREAEMVLRQLGVLHQDISSDLKHHLQLLYSQLLFLQYKRR